MSAPDVTFSHSTAHGYPSCGFKKGREGGREGKREGRRKGGREGGREGGRGESV